MVQKKKENGKRTLRKVRLARLLHGNALTPQILIIVSESQTSEVLNSGLRSHPHASFSTKKPPTAGDAAFEVTPIRSGGAWEFRLRHRVMGDDL